MSLIAAILGRLCLAAMFIVSGFQKLADVGTMDLILQGANLPANLAMPVAIFEIVAGLLLAVGLMTRLVSALLVVFVAGGIFFLHNQFTDPFHGTIALKDLAIIGGLLMTFAYGQMRGTYDYMRERRRTYDAELRAARAEGRAEGATTAPRTVVADTPRTVVTDVDGDGVAEVRRKRRWF
jgi:putative oxidoreductase